MIESVEYVEFHSPLFHAGKNFGTKVDVWKFPGLTIAYDDELSLFQIEYLNKKAKVPWTSAFLWGDSPTKRAPLEVNPHKTSDVTHFQNAQVETPMSHVFEGQGAGRVKNKK